MDHLFLHSCGIAQVFYKDDPGRLYAEEVASVVRESACVFPLLGICNRLKDSNLNCKCLTWLKYPYILTSLTSNSPFTWPTTNLESENISTAFPPILWTMVIPTSKASYSTSLFVVEKPNFNDFSMVIFLGETRLQGDFANWFSIHVLCFYLFLKWGFSELGHQICEDLTLNRGTRHVFDVKSP